jgi:hypothetical protein
VNYHKSQSTNTPRHRLDRPPFLESTGEGARKFGEHYQV